MSNEVLLHKTGTTNVGILCKDGIILAADRKITLGGSIVSNTKFPKVIIINEDLAITVAGLVSDVQLLTKIIRAQIKLDELKRGKKIKVTEAANMLANLVYNNSRKFSAIPGITGFLLGGKDKDGFYLYELGMDGSLTRFDDYTTTGSGMLFATGVLEANYREGLSIEDGVKLAAEALSAAMQRDTASGGGVDIVSITKSGINNLVGKQLDTKFRL